MIIVDASQAITASAIAGVEFDAQDNYCEPCRAYHVDASHEGDVPDPCGEVGIQGGDTVLECARSSHTDSEHRTLIGQMWRRA